MNRNGMTGAERCKLNKDAGFSLLELLIAVVILAIIVIPLLNLFLSSNRLNIKSRQTLRATTLAQDIMEGLKAYDIEELKTQFNTPADGFYVIDDNLIKGAIAEETNMEVDGSGNPEPGIYYFSMRDVSMQGSKFDALVKVDARGYMAPGTYSNADDGNLLVLNKAIADAQSIDKENGTFVEQKVLRKAVLNAIWSEPNELLNQIPDLPRNLEEALVEEGVDVKNFQDSLCFKELGKSFDSVERVIHVVLEDSTDLDDDGRPKIDVTVEQEYTFGYNGRFSCITKGDDKYRGEAFGQISRVSPNINIFYYPMYGDNLIDKITIDDNTNPANRQATDPKLNILIAKQLPPEKDLVNPDNPDNQEAMTDSQLMTAEMNYYVEVVIKNNGFPMSKDKLEDNTMIKTNLGLNLAGKAYVEAEGKDEEILNQWEVNRNPMSFYDNIYTLEGIPRPLGSARAKEGKITELFYNVEVSVYKEGAADKDFPEEERMIVIEGSKNN